MIRPVTVLAWTCPTCHEIGYATTTIDAERDLFAHRYDYH